MGTGGDSHTRFPIGISFPAGSGLVAFAAATGTMPLDMPESVLVRFSGSLQPGITLRDLVHAIPYEAKQRGLLTKATTEAAVISMIKWCKEDNTSFAKIIGALGQEDQQDPEQRELYGYANALYSGLSEGYSGGGGSFGGGSSGGGGGAGGSW